MSQQTINIGAAANDGTGDSDRAAWTKANANFSELYAGQAANAAAIAAETQARTSAGYLLPAALNGYATTSSVTAAISAAIAGLPPSNGGGLASFNGRTTSAAILQTADVTGVLGSGLPIAQGGTGAISATAALTALGAYPAANPAGYQTAAQVTTTLSGYLTTAAASTTYATPAQVTASVQAGLQTLLGGVPPAALDTLFEIATALAADESAAAALTATVAGKAPLASPALTGTPTAPTPAVDTNTTQLATAAFVLGQGASTPPLASGTAASGSSTRFARADHVHPATPTTFTRTAYTASGAIATTNTLAILNGSSALAMTLASGTTDGQAILIKLLGSASATVQATIDGGSQTVTLTASASGTIRDALKLRWSTADTSWLAE